MYARIPFELSPRISLPPYPSPRPFFLSSFFSHTCAHSRPHPLTFDIHPQNTRGWDFSISAKKFSSLPIDSLSLLFSPPALRPLPPMLPLLPLTPLDSALTKNRGEGPPGLPNLSTNPSQN